MGKQKQSEIELDEILLEFLREFEDKKHKAFELLEQGKIPRPAKAVEAEHIKLARVKIQALIDTACVEAVQVALAKQSDEMSVGGKQADKRSEVA